MIRYARKLKHARAETARMCNMRMMLHHFLRVRASHHLEIFSPATRRRDMVSAAPADKNSPKMEHSPKASKADAVVAKYYAPL